MCDYNHSLAIPIDHMRTEQDYRTRMVNLMLALDTHLPARITLRHSDSWCIGINGVVIDVEPAPTTTVINHVTPGIKLRDRAISELKEALTATL